MNLKPTKTLFAGFSPFSFGALLLLLGGCSAANQVATVELSIEHPESILNVFVAKCSTATTPDNVPTDCVGTMVKIADCSAKSCELHLYDTAGVKGGTELNDGDKLSIEITYDCGDIGNELSTFCGYLDGEEIKVKIDGRELSDETAHQLTELNGKYLPTNQRVDKFTSYHSFALSENMKLEIKGAPRQIASNELRLQDDSSYTYIDATKADVDTADVYEVGAIGTSKYCGHLGHKMRFCKTNTEVVFAADMEGAAGLPTEFQLDGEPLNKDAAATELTEYDFVSQPFLAKANGSGKIMTITSNSRTAK